MARSSNRCALVPALAALLFASGCPPETCRPGDTPTLTLGTGIDAFEPMSDPAELPLIYGPQGGVHLDLALRATYLDLSELWDVQLRGTLDGQVVADVRPQVEASCNVDAEAEDLVGLRLIFDDSVAAADLMDPIDVFATVTDAGDRTVEASVLGLTVTFD